MWGNSTLQISLIIHINDTVPREYKRCDGVIVPPTTTLDSHRVGHKGYSGISLLFSLTANISVHTLSLMGQPLPPSIHTVSQSVHVLHTLNGEVVHTQKPNALFFLNTNWALPQRAISRREREEICSVGTRALCNVYNAQGAYRHNIRYLEYGNMGIFSKMPVDPVRGALANTDYIHCHWH